MALDYLLEMIRKIIIEPINIISSELSKQGTSLDTNTSHISNVQDESSTRGATINIYSKTPPPLQVIKHAVRPTYNSVAVQCTCLLFSGRRREDIPVMPAFQVNVIWMDGQL